MPQPSKGPRLGGSPDHQKAMLANLATSLFTHGRIHTTRAKAERLRPYAERLITKARQGDLHNRRLIAAHIRDKDVVHRLMAEIGPFFADRPGGYTRITKTLPRKGDNAPMAVIELVSERTASAEAEQATRVGAQEPPRSPSGPGAKPGAGLGGAATGAAATAATIAAAEESGSPDADDATDADDITEDATEAESGESVASTESEPEGGTSVTLENDEPERPDSTATDLVTEQDDKS